MIQQIHERIVKRSRQRRHQQQCLVVLQQQHQQQQSRITILSFVAALTVLLSSILNVTATSVTNERISDEQQIQSQYLNVININFCNYIQSKKVSFNPFHQKQQN